jgi:ABC-type multidrug transport system permease subunit
MLVYLLALQMLVTALGYLFKWKQIAAILAGLLVTCLALVSGLPVHTADLGVWCKWLGLVSPVKWILPVLIAREYRPESLAASTGLCRNKQVPVLRHTVQSATAKLYIHSACTCLN